MSHDSLTYLTVYSIGSPVIIGEKIHATISEIKIGENDQIHYGCVWWDNNTRKTDWLNASEVHRLDDIQSTKIGFYPNNKKVSL